MQYLQKKALSRGVRKQQKPQKAALEPIAKDIKPTCRLRLACCLPTFSSKMNGLSGLEMERPKSAAPRPPSVGNYRGRPNSALGSNLRGKRADWARKGGKRPQTANTKSEIGGLAAAARKDKPDFVMDGNLFSRQQEGDRKKRFVPMGRGPAAAQYDQQANAGKEQGGGGRDPKSSRVLELSEEVIALKQRLLKSEEKCICMGGVVRRMERELNRCIKDNAQLLSAVAASGEGGSTLSAKDLSRIHRDNEKSDIVRALRNTISSLERKIADKDMHINGIMSSANATGLLEMAAARDEYFREVGRLGKLLKEARDDRDRMGIALENQLSREGEEKGEGNFDGDLEGDVKGVSEQPQGEKGGSSSSSSSNIISSSKEDILKSVIKAQHSRIQELKTKLATVLASGGGGGGGGAVGGGKRQVLSPKMQRERLAMQANRVDFKGQREAKRRVEEKKRKDKEEGRRKRREARGEDCETTRQVTFNMMQLLGGLEEERS